MSISTPELLTARELAEMEYTSEQSDKNRQHELSMYEVDYKIRKLEASWRMLLKLPLALLFLPVKLVLALAVVVAFAFGRDCPPSLWDLLKL